MRFATVLSLFATAALVAAQNVIGATETEPIFITSPVGSTDGLHAGKHLIIEWNSHPSAPEMVDIELLQNFKVRENIGKVKSDSHRFNWAIPDNLDSSKLYAIRIGNSSYTSYSHPFAIKGKGAFPENETSASGSSVMATAAITNTAAQTVSGSVIEMASSALPTSSHASTASASSTSAAASATASHSGGSSSKLAGASLVGAAAAGAAAVAFIL